jgi:ATP-dependent DNA ligase
VTAVYEEKVDGWRILAYKDGDRVRLVSRSGMRLTAHDIAKVDAILSVLGAAPRRPPAKKLRSA